MNKASKAKSFEELESDDKDLIMFTITDLWLNKNDQQEQGGEVGGQHLRLDLPLQGDHHVHLFCPVLKSEVCDGEHDQVFVIELQLLENFCLAVFIHHQHLSMQNSNNRSAFEPPNPTSS